MWHVGIITTIQVEISDRLANVFVAKKLSRNCVSGRFLGKPIEMKNIFAIFESRNNGQSNGTAAIPLTTFPLTTFPLTMFPLTTFPLKPNNDVSPKVLSPNDVSSYDVSPNNISRPISSTTNLT
jgi:hypothetical protein